MLHHDERFARRIHAEYERLTGGVPAGAARLSPEQREQAELARWLERPEDFRESSRQQAAHLYLKLRAIGCEIVPASDQRPAVTSFPAGQLEMLSRWEHDRWMAERLVANWRFAPGKKDTVRRTNQNLVPWEQLATEEIRDYDRTFVRLIPELLGSVGLKACVCDGKQPATGRAPAAKNAAGSPKIVVP